MADMPTPATLGSREVLRLPDFRRLWAAQGISDLGDGLTMLTLMLLVNRLTGSTLALAAVAIALAIPPLTIGLVAGTYADRWDRRRLMVVVNVLLAVSLAPLLIVDSAGIWVAYVVLLAAVSSLGTVVALVAAVVPVELPRPRSLASMDEAAVSRTARRIRELLGEEATTPWPRLVAAS